MASSSSSSSSSYNSPCAACKFLRRKCMPGCIFAPYFPPEEPQKFANVHKIFGASNVTKLLNDLLPHQREDAVNSLAYEAEARVRDPVYGCVGAISFLQRQIQRLQKELDAANADLIRYACNEIIATTTTTPNPVLQQQHMAPPPPPRRTRSIDHHQQFYHHHQQQGHQGQGAPPPAANFQVPYNNNLPWNNVDLQNRTSSGNGNDHINERGGGGGGEGRM